MAKKIEELPHVVTPRGIRLIPCAPHGVMARLGDKWTTLVIALMATSTGKRLRFSELRNGIQGISQRMLTVTLRNLERDGLIVRHYFPEVPPRVEYELSTLAKDMLPAMEVFNTWIREHWPAIEQARQDFDNR